MKWKRNNFLVLKTVKGKDVVAESDLNGVESVPEINLNMLKIQEIYDVDIKSIFYPAALSLLHNFVVWFKIQYLINYRIIRSTPICSMKVLVHNMQINHRFFYINSLPYQPVNICTRFHTHKNVSSKTSHISSIEYAVRSNLTRWIIKIYL